MKKVAEVKSLKPNKYVVIDDEPCKVLSIRTSKPGKHGEAKARIEAMGLFDGQKRSVVYPARHKVEVPVIDKRKAQIVSIAGDELHLMDLVTYETFTLPKPKTLDAKQGEEIPYMIALGRKKLMG